MKSKFRFTLKTFFLVVTVFSLFIFFFNLVYTEKPLKNPLRRPLAVASISKKGIIIEDGSLYKLAGIQFPKKPSHLKEALQEIEYLAKQGVEVVRETTQNTYFLLCAPKLDLSTCGNVPPRFRCEIFPLNEFLVASGYTTFDPKSLNLSAQEKVLFKIVEEFAKKNQYGVWSPYEEYPTQLIRDVMIKVQVHLWEEYGREYQIPKSFTRDEKKIIKEYLDLWFKKFETSIFRNWDNTKVK